MSPSTASTAAAVGAALDPAPAAALAHALKLASEDGPPLIAWGWLTLALARTTGGGAARHQAAEAARELVARMSPAQRAGAVHTLGRSVQHRLALKRRRRRGGAPR